MKPDAASKLKPAWSIRTRGRFRLALAIVLLLACCFTAGCKKAKVEVKRSRVVVGITQEPDTLLLPFKAMRASEMVVRTGAYTLTVYDEKWKTIPWAAKSIPTPDNGGVVFDSTGVTKTMTVTWTIRPRFAWPDGTPLSADDFVFGFEVQQHPELPVLDRTVVENVLRMEAGGPDRRTLVVTFKEPYAYYAAFDQHIALPAHLLRKDFRQDPHSLEHSTFAQRPALAGAFTIAEWIPGRHIVAKRNPRVGQALRPVLDEIIWRVIPKTTSLEANLLSGTIDAISPLGLTFDMALALERSHGDEVDVHFTESLKWEHIALNLDHAALSDRRVRRALVHGADRELMVKELFANRQNVAHGTVPRRSMYYAADVRRYAFDPVRARALLEEAGWQRGKDGIREKNGVRLEFVLSTTTGDRLREQVELLLQNQWQKIGVALKIENYLPRVFFGKKVRHRDFHSMAMFAWSSMPGVPRGNVWRCDRIPKESNRWQGQNLSGWCHEEATRLLDQASTTVNDQARQEMMRKFERIFAEELPAIPLWFRAEVSVTRKGLRGWRPTGTFQSVAWNAHEWRWE